MTDFTIRSDNVDVEQIMRQIRMRIKEKRGADYTEEEVRELANVKLERFLNPRSVRSELVEHYRRQRAAGPPPPDNYAFEEHTIYESSKAPVRFLRKLLNPILKLFFNPNPIIHVLHRQGKMNAYFLRRDEIDALNYEVLNNIVLELTRVTIEVKNLKMRLESMAARQDFNERRARAFEDVVQYKPSPEAGAGEETTAQPPEGGGTEEGEARRRRRRRRGRRRPGSDQGQRHDEGPGAADQAVAPASSDHQDGTSADAAEEPHASGHEPGTEQ